MTRRILGIDPGLRISGYGAIECSRGDARLIEAGVIAPRIAQNIEDRLRELHDAITAVIRSTKPTAIVIEELYTTYRNPLTAILMGHARGVLCLAGAQAGVPVRTLAHSFVKRSLVGSGGASKDQVNRMVAQMLGVRRTIAPNDVSDALALALALANVELHERRLPPSARKKPA